MIVIDGRIASVNDDKTARASKYKAFRLSDRHREMLAAIRDWTPGITTDTGAVRYLIETAYLAKKGDGE